jgi:hypothetical protein
VILVYHLTPPSTRSQIDVIASRLAEERVHETDKRTHRVRLNDGGRPKSTTKFWNPTPAENWKDRSGSCLRERKRDRNKNETENKNDARIRIRARSLVTQDRHFV